MSGHCLYRHDGNFHEYFIMVGPIELYSSPSTSTGTHYCTYTFTGPDDSYFKSIMTSTYLGWSIQVGKFSGISAAQFVSYNSSTRVITIYVYSWAAFTSASKPYLSIRFWAPVGTWSNSYTEVTN